MLRELHAAGMLDPTANVAHGVNTASAGRSSRAVAVLSARLMSPRVRPGARTPPHTDAVA